MVCGPSNLMERALCRDSDYRRLMMLVGRVVPGPIAMSDVGARQGRGQINQQGGRLPGWRRGGARDGRSAGEAALTGVVEKGCGVWGGVVCESAASDTEEGWMGGVDCNGAKVH